MSASSAIFELIAVVITILLSIAVGLLLRRVLVFNRRQQDLLDRVNTLDLDNRRLHQEGTSARTRLIAAEKERDFYSNQVKSGISSRSSEMEQIAGLQERLKEAESRCAKLKAENDRLTNAPPQVVVTGDSSPDQQREINRLQSEVSRLERQLSDFDKQRASDAVKMRQLAQERDETEHRRNEAIAEKDAANKSLMEVRSQLDAQQNMLERERAENTRKLAERDDELEVVKNSRNTDREQYEKNLKDRADEFSEARKEWVQEKDKIRNSHVAELAARDDKFRTAQAEHRDEVLKIESDWNDKLKSEVLEWDGKLKVTEAEWSEKFESESKARQNERDHYEDRINEITDEAAQKLSKLWPLSLRGADFVLTKLLDVDLGVEEQSKETLAFFGSLHLVSATRGSRDCPDYAYRSSEKFYEWIKSHPEEQDAVESELAGWLKGQISDFDLDVFVVRRGAESSQLRHEIKSGTGRTVKNACSFLLLRNDGTPYKKAIVDT